jgi:hypothetical protein
VDYVEPQYHQILLCLADERVEFIGVGMVSAILQGVPLTTMGLDIVHRRTPENVERLLRVLSIHRIHDRRDRRLGMTHEIQNLITRLRVVELNRYL